MTRYLVKPGDRTFVIGYEFLSFAEVWVKILVKI